ncbi:MAG: Gfo/Idh/MocA family oxidoreductase [Actinocatenispora sp.]
MSGGRLRVAVVGLGWVAREVWLPRLTGHPDFTVVAAVEPDPAAADRVRHLPAATPVYRQHTEVPDEVDAVFVLTPNHTHDTIAGWFLRRGTSVFLEKPTGTSPGQLDALERAARAGAGRLVLSAAARYRRDVGALRQLVDDGALGTPRLAELSWIRASGVPGSGWFTDRATAGGGVLVDLGWHVLDVFHQLWSPSPVTAAVAVAGHDFAGREEHAIDWRGHEERDARPVDVEDQLTALLTTDHYAAQLRFAWASHEEADRTVLTLHGTDASLTLTTTFGFSPLRVATPSLVLRRNGTVREIPLPAASVGEEYDRQLDALPDLFAAADPTGRSMREARDVLSVVTACYRAAGIG